MQVYYQTTLNFIFFLVFVILQYLSIITASFSQQLLIYKHAINRVAEIYSLKSFLDLGGANTLLLFLLIS